jgi:hypothetical protein
MMPRRVVWAMALAIASAGAWMPGVGAHGIGAHGIPPPLPDPSTTATIPAPPTEPSLPPPGATSIPEPLPSATSGATSVPTSAPSPTQTSTSSGPTIASPAPSIAQPTVPPDLLSGAPGVCPVAVKVVVQLDLGTAAIALYSLEGVEGMATGFVTLDASGERYLIPFRDAVAAGNFGSTKAAPLVVTFPKPVVIERAFVSALAGQNGGPCYRQPWIAEKAQPPFVPPPDDPDPTSGLRERAAMAVPIHAPPPTSEPTLSCRDRSTYPGIKNWGQPKVAAADLHAAFSNQFARTTLEQGALVQLDATGKVMGAMVVHPTGTAVLDDAAKAAVLRSTFAPERYRCESLGGIYMFYTEFSPPR